MQQKLTLILLLALLGAMSYLPRSGAQRSPYVPMPVNLPGLLPRFGETENNAASSGGSSGPAASSSSSSGGGGDFSVPSSEEDVGVRISEVGRPSRPAPSRGTTQTRCPPQQVPCYECVVHISKTGQITKFMNEEGGRRW